MAITWALMIRTKFDGQTRFMLCAMHFLTLR